MQKTLTELAQEIVQAQAHAKPMTMEEIRSSLQVAFQMLKSLHEQENGGEEAESARHAVANIEPKKSIKKNAVVCLECGQEFKMLSPKHLASHGLDAKSYRRKYGFSARQPLCAKSLSERRADSGKARGVPENLKKYLEARSAKKKEREAVAAPVPETPGKKPGGGKKKTAVAEPMA